MGWGYLRRYGVGLLAAGALAGAPASSTEVLWAQIGPFSGLPSHDAEEVNQGIRAYVAQANKTGLRGHTVVLQTFDDHYSPNGFVEQFRLALQKKPVALVSPIGSPAIKRMLDDHLLDGAGVVVVNAIPGAESLRTPGHPKLFHVRAGDRQQIEKFLSHARTVGLTHIGMVYMNVPSGRSGFETARAAGKAVGIEIHGQEAGAADVAGAVPRITTQGAQAYMVMGTPAFMADAVAALRKAGAVQPIFAPSTASAALMVKAAGVAGARGVSIARNFPDPNAHLLPLQRAFHDAMQALFPQIREYTAFQFEGYISARVLGEAMKRSKEAVPTGAGIAAALTAMGEVDLGGFWIDFSAGNAGSRFVDIGLIGSDGRLHY